MLQQINSYSTYREDFNSYFVTEFKRTDCFRQWQEANQSRIEKSLFNYNPTAGDVLPSSSSSSSTTTTSRLDTNNQMIPANSLSTTPLSNTPTAIDPAVAATAGSTTSSSSGNQWNSSQFQLLLSQLQEVDQRRLSHPFNGQIGVSDIRLRFNFMFSNSESGRKLNRALEEGGKLVNTTGKAVGSVLSSAKSTFSSLLSNWSGSTSSSPSASASKSKLNTKM